MPLCLTVWGWYVGDVITLEGDHGPLQVTVAAIGLDYLNMKLPTIYMDQTSLTREYGVRNDVFILLNAKPGADRGKLEEDFAECDEILPWLWQSFPARSCAPARSG